VGAADGLCCKTFFARNARALDEFLEVDRCPSDFVAERNRMKGAGAMRQDTRSPIPVIGSFNALPEKRLSLLDVRPTPPDFVGHRGSSTPEGN